MRKSGVTNPLVLNPCTGLRSMFKPRPGTFPHTNLMGGLVDPRAELDALEKRERETLLSLLGIEIIIYGFQLAA